MRGCAYIEATITPINAAPKLKKRGWLRGRKLDDDSTIVRVVQSRSLVHFFSERNEVYKGRRATNLHDTVFSLLYTVEESERWHQQATRPTTDEGIGQRT